MPLGVSSSTGLDIPAGTFNSDGLAVIMLSGGRYGGQWVITVSAQADGPQFGEFWADSDGRVLTGDPRYPDLAIETAFIWLMAEAPPRGWRVVSFENLNRHYGPGERPYFCLARAIIASSSFTPQPGAVYADQMTLAEVMAP